MERLILVAALVAGVLVSCAPVGRDAYRAWDPEFAGRPAKFQQAVTALWIATYQEDPKTQRFVRSTAWGEVPEKLVPDGEGGFTVAVPLLVQGETSDGPLPDHFTTILVRLVKSQGLFTLVPNEALPGETVGWYDEGRRTVWFRGRLGTPDGTYTRWQFQGRY